MESKKIIEAAGKVISEQGLNNATVRFIAEAAGTSTGLYITIILPRRKCWQSFDLNSDHLSNRS